MDELQDTGAKENAPTAGISEGAAAEARPTARPPRRGRRALILGFCCWHAGYLVYSILPRVAGQDSPGSRVLDAYRFLTGSRQVWRLFHTIPLMRSLRAKLETKNPDGTLRGAGLVLPGFEECPIAENSRFYTLTERLLTNPLGTPYRDSYVRKVNRLLNAELPPEKRVEWSLVFEGEAIRDLFYFRIDKRLSLPFRKEFGLEKKEAFRP